MDNKMLDKGGKRREFKGSKGSYSDLEFIMSSNFFCHLHLSIPTTDAVFKSNI